MPYVGSVAMDNKFLQVQLIFTMIPPMIPAPGVWEQTASWNIVTALVAAYWKRGVRYSFDVCVSVHR